MPELENQDEAQEQSGVETPEALTDDLEDLFAQGSIDLPAAPQSESEPSTEEEEPQAEEEQEPAEPQADDTPEEQPAEDETEPEAEEEGDEGGEEEQAKLFRYATAVAQNPNNIEQVPKALRGEAIKQVVAAAYQRAQQDAEANFTQRQTAEAQLRDFVARHEQIRQDDPDQFLEWQEANPEQAEQFLQAKRYMAQQAQPGEAQQPQSDAQAIQAQANDEFSRLAMLPTAARTALEQRVQNAEFALTPAGLKQLKAAIDSAFVSALEAPEDNETEQRAERRQKAAERRNSVARPAVSSGAGPDKSNPIRDVNDEHDLFAMAVEPA